MSRQARALCPHCQQNVLVDLSDAQPFDAQDYRLLVRTLARQAVIIGEQNSTISQLSDALDEARHKTAAA